MSCPSDFIIENGVLKKYKGPGGAVVVPEGVTSIGKGAFSDCRSMTSVSLPEHLADAAGSFDENVEVTVRGKPC